MGRSLDPKDFDDPRVAGIAAGLFALLSGEGRLLRTLSHEGTIEIDSTGVWLCEEGGMSARIVAYELEES